MRLSEIIAENTVAARNASCHSANMVEEQDRAKSNSYQYTGQISDPEERARIHDLKSLYGMFGNAVGVQRARHLDSKGLLKATPKEVALLHRLTDEFGTIKPRVGN